MQLKHIMQCSAAEVQYSTVHHSVLFSLYIKQLFADEVNYIIQLSPAEVNNLIELYFAKVSQPQSDLQRECMNQPR